MARQPRNARANRGGHLNLRSSVAAVAVSGAEERSADDVVALASAPDSGSF